MDVKLKTILLVVDDMSPELWVLIDTLEGAGLQVMMTSDGSSALERARRSRPDLILLEGDLPYLNGFELCRRFKADPVLGNIPVLLILAGSELHNRSQVYAAGGADFLIKPFHSAEVLTRVQTHLSPGRLDSCRNGPDHPQPEADRDYLAEIETRPPLEEIIGRSPAMRHCLDRMIQVAPTQTTVLIQGETGTGKELFARAIHSHSPRRVRPLVKVNCAALVADLLESELFGHEKGAFTGALHQRRGRFELADGGTLFLDEVGELPLAAQGRLLRVLQEQEFERVGGNETLRVDVRLVTATNRNLEQMVEAGNFRRDLFYRLNVYPLPIPPLRERREDISLLVDFILGRLGRRLGKPLQGISRGSLEWLMEYHWPGNVRELQNLLERTAVTAAGPVLEIEPPRAAHRPPCSAEPFAPCPLAEAEYRHIVATLEHTGWVVAGKGGAAQLLDLPPSTLRSRMQKLGIRRE